MHTLSRLYFPEIVLYSKGDNTGETKGRTMNGTVTISIEDYEDMKNRVDVFNEAHSLERKKLQDKIDALKSGGGWAETRVAFGWEIQTEIFTSEQIKTVIDDKIETIKKAYKTRGLWERIFNKEPE